MKKLICPGPENDEAVGALTRVNYAPIAIVQEYLDEDFRYNRATPCATAPDGGIAGARGIEQLFM